MDANDSKAIEELISREQIRDAIHRSARGIDRLDVELIRSAYHPGAMDRHGYINGTVEEYLEWLVPAQKDVVACTHNMTNILIDIRGDRAFVESYSLVLQRYRTPEGLKDKLANGRYLDIFERRNGEWKIADRTVTLDWNRLDETSDDVLGLLKNDLLPAARSHDDASYRILGDDFANR